MKEIMGVILLILVFFGLVGASYYVIFKIVSCGRKSAFFIVVPFDADSRCAADRLCCECMRLDMLGERSHGRVIALDIGMNGEERKKCEDFCRTVDNAYVCGIGDIEGILTEMPLNKADR